MDKDITITLNQNETQVLLQFIDIAVKAQGMLAAEAGVFLTRKIQEAAKQVENKPYTME